MTEPQEPEDYSLTMPFLVCVSEGGPYDDESFAAGWSCAVINEALQHPGVAWSGTVPKALLPQLDLIAMHRGYRLVQNDEIEDMPDEYILIYIGP